MRELSLFSGAGGGLLGSLLLGWTPVGYVEWDDYAQRILAARIQDGYLPAAPIFTDVREFLQSGAAAEYRGVADVVSGGFPCQPFSLAGKRAGADDPRNMWPATIATVRVVRPRFCFFENVPGLLVSGYFGTIINDLAESGYSVRWRCLSAAEVGAPHKRNRLWIVAYDDRVGQRQRADQPQLVAERSGAAHVGTTGQDVADAQVEQTPGVLQPWVWDVARTGCSSDMADTQGVGQSWAESQGNRAGKPEGTSGNGGSGARLADANRAGWATTRSQQSTAQDGTGPQREPTGPDWWATEPDVGRVAHGVAARVDRLKAIGNGQVPLVAATAWRLLTADLDVTQPG